MMLLYIIGFNTYIILCLISFKLLYCRKLLQLWLQREETSEETVLFSIFDCLLKVFWLFQKLTLNISGWKNALRRRIRTRNSWFSRGNTLINELSGSLMSWIIRSPIDGVFFLNLEDASICPPRKSHYGATITKFRFNIMRLSDSALVFPRIDV